MKKITLFILLASFILPMSLSAQSKFTNVSKNDIGLVKGVDKKTVNKLASRANGLMPQSIPIQSGIKGIHRAPGKATTWDFEDVSQLEDWSAVDADNDGYNWGYYNNSELEGGRMTTHSGDGVMASASYDNSVGPLTPDNWLISPEVSLGGTLSLWACGQDKTYYREVFGIFVCVGEPTSLNDFKQVGANVTTTGTMTEYQFDLSEYAGETGYFAIRHYKITDMFYLNIDDVTLDPNKVAEKDPTVPTNLSVATASTSANVTWEDTDDVAWNLRYRVYSPNEAQTLSWDLEDTSQLSGWLVYDKDGDGNNWGYTSYGDTYAFFSASYLYNSGESLDPDNWLLSPEVKFGGTLSFKALSADPNYLDSFGVFLLLSEDMDKEDFANYAIQLGADQTAPGQWTEYTYDLSAYEGKTGQFIIRHYHSSDNFYLFVDDITLDVPGDEPAEWIYVNNLNDTEYTIENLTVGTDYMVQVQAITEDKESEWTEPVIFKLITDLVLLDNDLDQEKGSTNDDLIEAAYNKTLNVTLKDRVFYKDGCWNTLCLPFSLTKEQIANSPLAGAIIKELDDAAVTGTHVDISFAPSSEISSEWFYIFKWEEPGENIVSPVFNDVTIDQVDAPFVYTDDFSFFAMGNYSSYIADSSVDGYYTYYLGADNKLRYSDSPITLHNFRFVFIFFANDTDPAPEVSINIDDEVIDGIVDVNNARKANDHKGTYNLQGVKVNKPMQKGIYIVNGRKVVIK